MGGSRLGLELELEQLKNRENNDSLNILSKQTPNVVHHLSAYLVEQRCFQKAWSQSSVEPAELQEESSNQFLSKIMRCN